MNNNEKRRIVAYIYPSKNWRDKVKAMTDRQVHAIYMRLLEEGKLKGLVK